VADIGCGPGFFTVEMARLVGSRGKVLAVDVQKRMLDILRRRSAEEGVEERIVFHQCGEGPDRNSGKTGFHPDVLHGA